MASLKIEWKQSAKKELRKLPDQARQRILAVVEGLQEDPRPPGSKKLVGVEQTYRLRVGDYRVIYSFQASALCVEIIRVADRKVAYR
jgi:mRNA interferase RelE/StbE